MLGNAKKPTPKPTAKPSPSPSTFDQKAAWTEKEFSRLLKMGVPINKAREQAAKKYKINPNGYTN